MVPIGSPRNNRGLFLFKERLYNHFMEKRPVLCIHPPPEALIPSPGLMLQTRLRLRRKAESFLLPLSLIGVLALDGWKGVVPQSRSVPDHDKGE